MSDQDPRVPPLILLELNDSLTPRGIAQWWTARNRYLDGDRPCDVDAERALEAARAFAAGAYI